MFKRLLGLIAAGVLVLAFVPAALAVRVHIRVEGRTTTIFGATQPFVSAKATVLDALEAASGRGEFYYHVKQFSFGALVDQIGRYANAGSNGWTYKVNGAVAPVAADQQMLKDGDVVLWYWTTFSETGGPKTLVLTRAGKRNCYRVLAQDDAGKESVARGAVLNVDRRTVLTKAGRACLRGSHGLVRATLAGAIRSNVLP